MDVPIRDAGAARAAEHTGQTVYRGRASGQVADYVRSVRPLTVAHAGGWYINPEERFEIPVVVEVYNAV